VHLWYGDERCVPLDDPESNHRAVREALDAPDVTWHPVPTHLGCDESAAAYAEEIADVTLDVAVNGMGPDGHTASLFPGFPQVDADGVCVAVHGSPKPPPDRVTLTLPKLNAAHRILLVVTGAAKAPLLARVLAGPDPEVPASLLNRERLEIVADAAALDG
jgi:6-phosphogluconolactonase